MKQVLLAVDGFNERQVDRFRAVVEGKAVLRRVSQTTADRTLRLEVLESQAVMGWPKPAWVAQGDLEWVQLGSAGFDAYVGKGLARKEQFTLCNARGAYDVGCVEQVLAMMFTLVRKLHLHQADRATRTWRLLGPYGEITGSTACVIGLGSIGTELATRLRALGVRVVGVRQQARPHPAVDELYTSDQLRQAVGQADHVILTAPAQPDGQPLLDATVLAAMKPGAYVYNVGRGSLIDEKALVAALQSGQLAGAGLDVFATEPLPPQHAFWTMENVIVTPHSGGRSAREYERLADIFLTNLRNWVLGRPMINVVPASEL